MTGGTAPDEGILGGVPTSWAHYSDLVAYARRVLGDRSDCAEDIVQEAYLRLLALAASDEAPASARPWLFRVVRNLAIDERRGAARRADPVADAATLGVAALDTAAVVEQRAELAGTLRHVAALPPRERRAIEMDQAGLAADAIAGELGTTTNAVHQALFRARKRLRNARAVAWGLIPVGLVPLALRAGDPALAVTAANLPPGLPVGRALPVAGLVAAAVVGGSVVAPDIDRSRGPSPTVDAIANAARARAASTVASTVAARNGGRRSAGSDRVASVRAAASPLAATRAARDGKHAADDSGARGRRIRARTTDGGGDDRDSRGVRVRERRDTASKQDEPQRDHSAESTPDESGERSSGPSAGTGRRERAGGGADAGSLQEDEAPPSADGSEEP